MLRRRPNLAPVLFRDFYWHYFEPQMAERIHFTRPICTQRGGRLNTFFIPWYIRLAQELPDVPPHQILQHLRGIEFRGLRSTSGPRPPHDN